MIHGDSIDVVAIVDIRRVGGLLLQESNNIGLHT